MSVDPRQLKRWPSMMMKKFESARKNTDYKIVSIDADVIGDYYIMLTPTGGFYKGHTYILEFRSKWGENNIFPFTPPLVKFITSIWHPNISVTGSICVDILKDTKKWSPQYDINAVISSIILLLDTPNEESPFNAEAAVLYRDCSNKYKNHSKNMMNHNELDNAHQHCFKSYIDKLLNHSKKNKQLDDYISKFDNYIEKLDEMKL